MEDTRPRKKIKLDEPSNNIKKEEIVNHNISTINSEINNSIENNNIQNTKVEENYDDPYIFDCIGGCGSKTNGSQYCCKLYCPYEIYKEN